MNSLSLNEVLKLFKKSFIRWYQNEAVLHAAALAYYTIFSLAPLLIICIAIATQIFSQAVAEGEIAAAIDDYIGTEAANVVQEIIKNSRDLLPGSFATGITILFVLYGASSVFRQMRYSLNAMWGITPKAENVQQGLIVIIKEFSLAVAAILTVGFFLLGSLLLNTLWTAVPQEYLHQLFPNLDDLNTLFRFGASPLLFMVIFAAIFKTFPKARIRWRDVWLGAAVTALFFWLGGYLIGLYLAYSAWTSIYGAAGSLIAFLLWVYYSAWIFLFGAVFTQQYANTFGTPIVPDEDAKFVAIPL